MAAYMKTPVGKRIILTLHSLPHKDLRQRWKTTVEFAPESTGESIAQLAVVDGEGTPVDEGEFEFAGTRTKIAGGKGGLKCADFIAGKHEPAVWLYRPGMSPVPGMLTFE
jgi:hypothetical protein